MADPDWTDPCAIATWLKPQLYQVAAGTAVVTVRYDNRETTFRQASYPALVALYRNVVAECARKQKSSTGRRRAFTGG